ncbi:hypothetical protein OG884_17450 [Streptosporangium sp. NBC_01755]|uniref:hypothetical protein n=1 Tax=Streptosporangium sp. NBC_01755 TaxID=2975949 RepID=UPI002DD81A3C|nr:hypothetical protein [Streptosporangium sp. NBC_01755]WSD03596.1 hypothetical protein OG884_17450 [Streptosporangium sp. NBC_01755]
MIENKKGRPGGGDLPENSSNAHPHDSSSLSGLTNGHKTYPTSEEAAPIGGLRFPAPRGEYVAKYEDGETWDVVGFDLRGNPLISVAGEIVRANAFPLYEDHGFAGRLPGTYKTGSIVGMRGVAA